MRRLIPTDFSIAPLAAMVPGFTLLAAFAADKTVTVTEALLSASVIGLGAIWAGLKQSRTFLETITKVDTTLASVVVDALPDPVLLLDGRRRVVAANRAAEELLGSGVHGRDICLTLRQPEAQDILKKTVAGTLVRAQTELLFETPVRRIFHLQVMGVPKGAAMSLRAVAALHEVTALKSVENMRADFVANVSHELRSPLSALTGFIETLQTTAQDDAEAQVRFLKIMEGEAGRMARLIDDLLSLSKIEVNEHIRPTQPVSLSAIISGVVETVQIKVSKKNMMLAVNLPDDLADVPGDADQLREVFQNLIENAIKYGAEKTSVIISARAVAAMVETGTPGVDVSITDQGDGIAAEHLPRLTERFYRIDKGRSRAMGGTGLGLAIVKHIVNRHRGRLNVTSVIGKGSCFSVQLPIMDRQIRTNP
ncbi:MAG: PAS domain-containing protein [Magnetovibrio sp.]|nr:PAS domain-containing protein [Magnetovibrio sp.]